MGQILAIARRDFMALATSIRGATIFFFLLVFIGFFYYSFIQNLLEAQMRAPMMGGEAPGLDQLLRALFFNIHFIMLLVVPAVTMGTFSEEMRTQTYRLLQTAPVSSFQIVLGKFLASTSIVGLALLFSAVYPIFMMVYGNPDAGQILSGYLGLFLLMCSQIAFGVWISSMTRIQFLSFIFTMFGLFMLLILSWIASQISGGGISESVFKYLASSSHLEDLFKGVITVSGVSYFICFTVLFLFLTNAVIDSKRWR